uniref:AAA+ ATPase domain-containing protein n=1 Tax=Panagrolaimus davidi TaxID=227884 RepID=A0A914PXT3_9BILA
MSSANLFNKFKDLAFETEKPLIIINNVNKLKGLAPLIIQRIIDPDTAPSKNATLILTASGIKFPPKMETKKQCEIFVRKYLLDTWSSDDLSEEQTEPIISRCAGIVICSEFNKELNDNFFGQHIAYSMVGQAIEQHLESLNPNKALALAFLGGTGRGKTYLTTLLAKTLFKDGEKSQFYHKYIGIDRLLDDESEARDFAAKCHQVEICQYHISSRNVKFSTEISKFLVLTEAAFFTNDSFGKFQLDGILPKKDLVTQIRESLTKCAHSVFVFDEMDKFPRVVIDSLLEFIDYDAKIYGKHNSRKAVFIFLSNSATRIIDGEVYKHIWENQKSRTSLRYENLKTILREAAFNDGSKFSGLRQSEIVRKSLINYYIPFLPLEKVHVIQCINAYIKKYNENKNPNKSDLKLSEEERQRITNEMEYSPQENPIFSKQGCKTVEEVVTTANFKY